LAQPAFRHFSQGKGVKIVNMMIAEIFVGNEPTLVSTVLGSCVSVCLYLEGGGAGGIIHFALPDSTTAGSDAETLRYGDLAIPELIQQLQDLTGETPRRFLAKVVGGASTLSKFGTLSCIGESNVNQARQVLARHGIQIVNEDVGGDSGRKILFYPQTGRVQVALLDERAETVAKKSS
jgi:chemotaxis receptor (MCP) glutamine deamidase CheD